MVGTLESKDFKISCTKIKYMHWNSSEHLQRVKTTVWIEIQEIPQKYSFCYLGSISSNDRETDEGVKHRIKVVWLKWKLASVVLCDRRMLTR